jgi:hypothetical protein
MGDTFRKQLTGMCLLVAACGVFWSCSLQEEAPLRAEVKMARESVYVLNKGDRTWRGGIVFLNQRSQRIQKSFGMVKPGGFAQLPLREFCQGSSLVSEGSPELQFVWVEVEGYAPKKFKLGRESR